MYAEHWTKTSMDNFLGKFSVAYLNLVLLCFRSKNKFFHSIWLTGYFDFLFCFYSAILLSKMKSLFFNLYTRPSWVMSREYFDYWLPRGVSTNLQIQRFPLIKFSYTIWMYWGSNFQSNNIEKHPSHKYLFFFESASVNLLLIILIIVTLPKNNRNYCRKIYKNLSKQLNLITQHNLLALADQNLTIMPSW